jgi:hypothetical protein
MGQALSQQPGIGPGYAQKVFTKFLETGNLDNVCSSGFGRNLPARVFSGLNGFKRILSGIVDKELLKSPDEIIRKIIDSGYEAYARLHFENAKDRIDDLHELVNFAHQYKSMNVFLQTYLSENHLRARPYGRTGRMRNILFSLQYIRQKGLSGTVFF